jgi:hypothetical protein
MNQTDNQIGKITAAQLAERYKTSIQQRYLKFNKDKNKLADWFLASFFNDLPTSEISKSNIESALDKVLPQS